MKIIPFVLAAVAAPAAFAIAPRQQTPGATLVYRDGSTVKMPLKKCFRRVKEENGAPLKSANFDVDVYCFMYYDPSCQSDASSQTVFKARNTYENPVEDVYRSVSCDSLE